VKLLSKCIIACLCLWPRIALASGIYGNGAGSEDSIAVSVYITDSLGNPSMTQADSFYISIIGPSGDSILTLTGVAATAGLNIDSFHTVSLGWKYIYAEAVSEIDGSGRPGVYELIFCAKDNSPDYVNCTAASFQITAADFNDQLAVISNILDSLLAVLDTLRNQDNWVSSYDPAEETVLCNYQTLAQAVWDEDTSGHQSTGSYGLMLKDTAAYQGSASGLTAAELADSVWDEMQLGHTTAGSFGFYLDGPISGVESPTGTGIFPVTLTAFDSLNDQVIPGVRMSVYNAQLDALLAVGLSSTEGAASLNLDAGIYVISAFAPGYIFEVYDTIIVTGAADDTISAARFDPGDPSSPELCRVYGFLYGIDGRPMEGVTVAAELSDGVVRHNSMIISPYRRAVLSDSAGYFYLDLIPSGDLDPAGAKYSISALDASGTILKKKLTIPDSTSWQLAW